MKTFSRWISLGTSLVLLALATSGALRPTSPTPYVDVHGVERAPTRSYVPPAAPLVEEPAEPARPGDYVDLGSR